MFWSGSSSFLLYREASRIPRQVGHHLAQLAACTAESRKVWSGLFALGKGVQGWQQELLELPGKCTLRQSSGMLVISFV